MQHKNLLVKILLYWPPLSLYQKVILVSDLVSQREAEEFGFSNAESIQKAVDEKPEQRCEGGSNPFPDSEGLIFLLTSNRRAGLMWLSQELANP